MKPWPTVCLFVALIIACAGYEIFDTLSFNAALAACAKAGGDIHVTWNGRRYCDHKPTAPE